MTSRRLLYILCCRLISNQWVLVRTKTIPGDHYDVYIPPLVLMVQLLPRSLPKRGDAICFKLALARKETFDSVV